MSKKNKKFNFVGFEEIGTEITPVAKEEKTEEQIPKIDKHSKKKIVKEKHLVVEDNIPEETVIEVNNEEEKTPKVYKHSKKEIIKEKYLTEEEPVDNELEEEKEDDEIDEMGFEQELEAKEEINDMEFEEEFKNISDEENVPEETVIEEEPTVEEETISEDNEIIEETIPEEPITTEENKEEPIKEKEELENTKTEVLDVTELKKAYIESKKEENNVDTKKDHSFELKVAIYLVTLLVALSIGIYVLSISVTNGKDSLSKITEKGKINYQVNLKQNDFYDKPYLEEGMSYVANLIKDVEVTYDYNLLSEKNLNGKLTYRVTADLVISEEASNNVFFKKEYQLVDNVVVGMEDTDKSKIKDSLIIDYNYYNNLANKFKQEYGLSTVSNLVLHFRVSKGFDGLKLSSDNIYEEMTLTIPLSQKAVNINIDSSEINDTTTYYDEDKMFTKSRTPLVIIIVLGIIYVYCLSKLIQLAALARGKKTKYDKYLDKILKEYDRLIVETNTIPNEDDFEVFKINEFQELLDVRDNLKLPIMHVVITKHIKSYFYIKHEKNLYIYKLKAVDIENKKM